MRTSRTDWLRSLGSYLVVFGVLAAPWLRVASHAIPRAHNTPFVYADDARLIIWVLGWVAHALATSPGTIVDAPINYPAPGQLAGSEHFGASQLVAAPIFWSTGNAVLAANMAAFVCYPLAALAMERLLVALEVAPVVAWIAGFLFATGPLYATANLQVLQYPSLFLPLVALALLRLRHVPEARAAVALGVVLLAGLFSSYHMAVMLLLTGAVWGVVEIARPGPRRVRFVVMAMGVTVLALVVLVLASRPYFARPEASGGDLGAVVGVPVAKQTSDTFWFPVRLAVPLWGAMPLALAAAGLLALGGGSAVRRLAIPGIVLALSAAALMLPPVSVRALIDASPLRFLRAPFRLAVVSGFGTTLLAAAALQLVWPRRSGRLVVAFVGLALLVLRGRHLVETGTEEIGALAADRPVYDAVARAGRDAGGGALLELPLTDANAAKHGSDVPRGFLEPDAMVGSTRHWLPLLSGRTGYPPPHRTLFEQSVARLSAPGALADLVDMTHVRWLLLRPVDYWADAATRAALLTLPGVGTVLERDGWTLARIEREPAHPEWFASLSQPPQPGRTVLGAALAPLDAADAIAEVDARPEIGGAQPRALVTLAVGVRNAGTKAWPVAVPTGVAPWQEVHLTARWRPEMPGAADAGSDRIIALQRDVVPGERVELPVILATPAVPGTYVLEIAAEQTAGSRFDGPGNRPVRWRVRVGW